MVVLHGLLLLLKIIGIILLVVLGLVFLAVLIVLCVPIRYSFEGGKPEQGDLSVRIKVSWLFSLVCAEGAYVGKKLSYKVRIAWKVLKQSEKQGVEEAESAHNNREDSDEVDRKDTTDEKDQEKDLNSEKDGSKSEEAEPEEDLDSKKEKAEPEEESDPEEDLDLGEEESELVEESEEEAEPKEDLDSEEDKTKLEEESEPEEESDLEEESELEEDSQEEEPSDSGQTLKKEDSFPEQEFWEEELYEELEAEAKKEKEQKEEKQSKQDSAKADQSKDTAKEASDQEEKPNPVEKIKEQIDQKVGFVTKKIEEVKGAIEEYRVAALLPLGKDCLFRIIAYVLPTRLSGELGYGFDDPALTGMLTGFVAMFYPKYEKTCSVYPDFTRSCFYADVKGKGRIRAGFFVRILLRILFNKDARYVILKLIKKKR